ncbi:YbaY family lipoprotein [Paucibacter sediminis]|uniref:YbaY family lipoprotein n=1 Tax=Paucibacter sediminis TaxID=3019553 RepID=A0AA95SMX2_9BURK|nr:YbaY family lipoprotein [Paucibacter sp. S2-9]WIT10625.1 YbaY family lipoprotein [Paucibacter sp. S2-9]
MTTRRISGQLLLPAQTPAAQGLRVRVEVRDVSLQDVASVLVAAQVMEGVAIAPGQGLAFELMAPEVPPGRSHALQVRVEQGGASARLLLLSTVAQPLPAKGELSGLELTLTPAS